MATKNKMHRIRHRICRLFHKPTTQQLLEEYLKMAQADIDAAVKAMTDATAALTTINTQITGLGANTAALAPAATALGAAVSTLQATVAAESAPPAPAVPTP